MSIVVVVDVAVGSGGIFVFGVCTFLLFVVSSNLALRRHLATTVMYCMLLVQETFS